MTWVLYTLLIGSLIMNLYPVVNIIIVLAFVPLYLRYGFGQKNPCPIANPTKWLLWAYLYSLLSYFLITSDVANFFSFDFLRRDGAVFFAYLPLLIVGAYGLKMEQVQKLVNIYLSWMAALAVFGAAQFGARLGLLPDFLGLLPEPLTMVHDSATAGTEFHALISAHNAAGGAYAIASVLALAMLLFVGDKPKIRTWPTVWFGLNFMGLALTGSRGSYVAFCGALLLVFLRSKTDLKRAVKPLILVFIPVLFLLAQQSQLTSRVSAIGAGEADPNIVVRLIMWPRAINDFIASPVTGIGFGRFNDDNLKFYGIPNFIYVATRGEIVNSDAHAHNSFLHYAAEGGIIGLVLMVGIWVSVYRWAKWAQSRFEYGTFGYALARALCACVILESIMSMTDHMMNSAVTTIAIFTLFGLLRNAVQACDDRLAAPARAFSTSTVTGGDIAEAHG